MNVFDFVKNISESTDDVYEGNEKEYNPFIINKALSFNVDCVFLAHELSKFSTVIDKRSQYLFWLNSLDKKRRYGKWVKKDSLPQDITLIKEAFDLSDRKALEALAILTDKQLLELKQLMSKGGKT
jgi:Bacteriophage clamp loader A subunit